MGNKPIIAVTGPVHEYRVSWLFCALSIYLSGGRPVRVTSLDRYQDLDFDGLLISGGTDIFPDHYGGNIKDNYTYDHERDRMEFSMLARAEQDGKPVLGICRGAQLMNIYRRGTLHFDVKLAYEKAEYPSSLFAHIFYRKMMYLKSGDSLLARILQKRKIKVNSMHTQAVDRLGRNLKITGQEENGVVQAIEDPDKPYFMGVQFHPEYMIYKKKFREMFKKLVICTKNM